MNASAKEAHEFFRTRNPATVARDRDSLVPLGARLQRSYEQVTELLEVAIRERSDRDLVIGLRLAYPRADVVMPVRRAS